MSELRLTRSHLLHVEKTNSALEEFARTAAYAGIQQPISGVAQLVDRTVGSKIESKLHMIAPTKEAKFGTTLWHAQAAGGAVGTLLPFMVSTSMAKGIIMPKPGCAALASEARLGLTLREAATAGAINDSLFRPVDPKKGFWQERLLNGGTGALSFTVITASSVGLTRLSQNKSFAILKNPIAAGVISGVPAGIVGANLESLHHNKRLATTSETLKSIYQMSFAGGFLAGQQKFLEKGAKVDQKQTVEAPFPELVPIFKTAEATKQAHTDKVVAKVTEKDAPPVFAIKVLETPKDKVEPTVSLQKVAEPQKEKIEQSIKPEESKKSSRQESIENAPPKIDRIDPPLLDFYTKETYYNGIPIRSAECVSNAALIEAHSRIKTMLENSPEIANRLYMEGAEFHIIGKDQAVSDLPHLRKYKNKPFDGEQTIDERTRGVGERYSSCGEENLLQLPGDRYHGYDICIHEFSHTVHLYGLTPATSTQISKQYQAAKDAGKWTGAYAIKNELEYFAELSTWYFGKRGDCGAITPTPQPGREWLAKYDPEGYALIHSIYKKPPEAKPSNQAN